MISDQSLCQGVMISLSGIKATGSGFGEYIKKIILVDVASYGPSALRHLDFLVTIARLFRVLVLFLRLYIIFYGKVYHGIGDMISKTLFSELKDKLCAAKIFRRKNSACLTCWPPIGHKKAWVPC